MQNTSFNNDNYSMIKVSYADLLYNRKYTKVSKKMTIFFT